MDTTNRAVAAAEMRYRRRRRSREQDSVERAVDDVADCSGDDKCQTDDDAFRGIALVDVAEVVYQCAYHSDPEQAQHKFAPVECAACRKLHSEGCAVVFDEPQPEPVGNYDDCLFEMETGFNPDFQCLVYNHEDDYKYGCVFQIHVRNFLC